MESKSTGKSKVEKLIHSLDYAHNILPYYGYLHEAALFMLRLSSKSNQLFKSNIEILRRLTFSSDNQIKTLNISSEFTQKIIDFIISNKLYVARRMHPPHPPGREDVFHELSTREIHPPSRGDGGMGRMHPTSNSCIFTLC